MGGSLPVLWVAGARMSRNVSLCCGLSLTARRNEQLGCWLWVKNRGRSEHLPGPSANGALCSGGKVKGRNRRGRRVWLVARHKALSHIPMTVVAPVALFTLFSPRYYLSRI